jgi:hypothetical protein
MADSSRLGLLQETAQNPDWQTKHPLREKLIEVIVLKPEGQPHAEDGHEREEHDSVKNLPALPADLGDPSFGSPAKIHGRLLLDLSNDHPGRPLMAVPI